MGAVRIVSLICSLQKHYESKTDALHASREKTARSGSEHIAFQCFACAEGWRLRRVA